MPLVRLGPLAVPTPSEVLRWSAELVDVGATLPGRVDALLDEASRLLTTLGRVTDRVDGLIGRAEGIVGDIEGVIDEARGITTGVASVVDEAGTITKGAGAVVDDAGTITRSADAVVAEAHAITRGASEVVDSARTITTGADEVMTSASSTSHHAQELLDLYRPMLERAAPLAGKFVDDLAPEEIDAAIRLVDELPALAHHLSEDVLPILETLDRVGPDLSELLAVTKDLRRAIDGIPGFSFLKRRGETRAEDRDE
jgi:ABC-type transporter Mla subunit MlaD